MATTKSQIITRFRMAGFYPDCPPAIATQLFDEAAKTVLKNLRIRNGESVINLVAGQREYGLGESVLSVGEAYFERSDSPAEWLLLDQTTLDSLARRDAGWRIGSYRGIPSRFYIGSAVNGNSSGLRIGLDPVPTMTSSDGYPRIRLYTTAYVGLEDTDPIYDGLLSEDAYLFHMARAWARRQDSARADYWDQLYQKALAEESAHVRGRAEGAPAARILNPFAGRMRGQI